MQSGRTKTVVTIQHSLDGKQDVKRVIKEFGKRTSRHAESQRLSAALKYQDFDDFDTPVYRTVA